MKQNSVDSVKYDTTRPDLATRIDQDLSPDELQRNYSPFKLSEKNIATKLDSSPQHQRKPPLENNLGSNS